jgi:hypothetical protein
LNLYLYKISSAYKYLHEYFNKQNRYTFPFNKNEIKKISDLNGLYILFEKGETYYGMDRIVRIGSHYGHNRLVRRLSDHFLSENQRNSVFRKHIGRSILNEENNPYLNNWNLPFKKIIDKEKNKNLVNLEYEYIYEQQVSKYINANFSFCIIPKIYQPELRNKLEKGIISTLSQSHERTSSANWRGNFHPDSRIKESKLWNIEYLNETPLSVLEIKELLK